MKATRRMLQRAQRYPGAITCYHCHRFVPIGQLTVDHLLPRSRGGGTFGNLVYSCKACNEAKGDRTVEEWRSGHPGPRVIRQELRRIVTLLTYRSPAQGW